MINSAEIQSQFPFFQYHPKLHYLDSAATTQKPAVVIKAIQSYYEQSNANPHRGTSSLSAKSTDLYESARAKVAQFIGATDPSTLVFTRNTTTAINLVAFGLGRKILQPGDEIVLTELEHHSNLIPWQIVAAEAKAAIRFVPVNQAGELDLIQYRQLLNQHTKIVALTHVSNVLGNKLPINEMAKDAHRQGAVVLVDGAQAVGHQPVNVQDLEVDFYAFSAHKMYGPLGIGGLYGRKCWLTQMDPIEFGGGMINQVSFNSATWTEIPHRFEAGTPAVAEAVGWQAAIEYLQQFNWADIESHEQSLINEFKSVLTDQPWVKIYGENSQSSSLISFNVDQLHPHDLAQIIDDHGVIVRAGHHCAMPLMTKLSLPGTVRASVGLYTSKDDMLALATVIKAGIKVFK